MNRLFLLGFLVLSLLFSNCEKEVKPDVIILQVADHQVDCVGVAPQKCLLVKQENETNWTYFYSGIDGFSFEPGYAYTLRVNREKVKNPPADGSSFRYKLVELIEKTKT